MNTHELAAAYAAAYSAYWFASDDARATREDAYDAAFLLRARGHNNGYVDARAAYAVADIAYSAAHDAAYAAFAAAVKAAIAASK